MTTRPWRVQRELCDGCIVWRIITYTTPDGRSFELDTLPMDECDFHGGGLRMMQ